MQHDPTGTFRRISALFTCKQTYIGKIYKDMLSIVFFKLHFSSVYVHYFTYCLCMVCGVHIFEHTMLTGLYKCSIKTHSSTPTKYCRAIFIKINSELCQKYV